MSNRTWLLKATRKGGSQRAMWPKLPYRTLS